MPLLPTSPIYLFRAPYSGGPPLAPPPPADRGCVDRQPPPPPVRRLCRCETKRDDVLNFLYFLLSEGWPRGANVGDRRVRCSSNSHRRGAASKQRRDAIRDADRASTAIFFAPFPPSYAIALYPPCSLHGGRHLPDFLFPIISLVDQAGSSLAFAIEIVSFFLRECPVGKNNGPFLLYKKGLGVQ